MQPRTADSADQAQPLCQSPPELAAKPVFKAPEASCRASEEGGDSSLRMEQQREKLVRRGKRAHSHASMQVTNGSRRRDWDMK